MLLHLVLDVDSIGVLKVGGLLVPTDISQFAILSREGSGIEQHFALFFSLLQADAHRVEVGDGNQHRRGEHRHFQFIAAIILGQHGISFYLVSTDNRASHGLSRSGIQHTATDDACGILLLLLLDDPGLGFHLVVGIIVLSHDAYREGHQQCKSE